MTSEAVGSKETKKIKQKTNGKNFKTD